MKTESFQRFTVTCSKKWNWSIFHSLLKTRKFRNIWQIFTMMIRVKFFSLTLPLRGKYPNTNFFLARIQKNTDQKKRRIWTLFTQCTKNEFRDIFTIKCIMPVNVSWWFHQKTQRQWKRDGRRGLQFETEKDLVTKIRTVQLNRL